MNQITTINGFSGLELEAMQKLPEYQQFYIQAKNETKIIHADKQEVLTQLYAIIIKTIELSGENKKYNLDNQTIKNVAGFVFDYTLQNYKGATLSELKNAFKMGISGEFGEYVGYGTVTFTKFIKGYMTLAKREQAIKEWFKYQNTTQITDKPVTKFFEKNIEICNYFFNVFDERLIDRYDTVLNHEDNVMFLPAIFDFLKDNYKITFTQESANEIQQKAKIKYNNYIKKSGIKEKDSKGYNLLIESVINGNNRTFEYYSKLQALIFLTLKLKQQNKTYNDLKRL
jgi:hypothetical protein